MEGRARARPNEVVIEAATTLPEGPSMEGRARARPNSHRNNGTYFRECDLQWRAGHVPGQTSG